MRKLTIAICFVSVMSVLFCVGISAKREDGPPNNMPQQSCNTQSNCSSFQGKMQGPMPRPSMLPGQMQNGPMPGPPMMGGHGAKGFGPGPRSFGQGYKGMSQGHGPRSFGQGCKGMSQGHGPKSFGQGCKGMSQGPGPKSFGQGCKGMSQGPQGHGPRGMNMRGRGRGMHKGPQMMNVVSLLSKLDLKSDQIEKIATVIKTNKESCDKLRDQMKELRCDKDEFMITDTFDEAKVKSQLDAKSSLKLQMIKAKADLYNSILKELNDEQKKQLTEEVAKVKKIQAEMKQLRRERENMEKFNKLLKPQEDKGKCQSRGRGRGKGRGKFKK